MTCEILCVREEPRGGEVSLVQILIWIYGSFGSGSPTLPQTVKSVGYRYFYSLFYFLALMNSVDLDPHFSMWIPIPVALLIADPEL